MPAASTPPAADAVSEADQDEEEKKRRRYIVLALLVLLLLLLCLGGVLYWLLAIRPSEGTDPDPSATSSTSVTTETSTTTPATETSTTTPTTPTTTTTTPTPATIAVPVVIGQTVGEAVDILEQAGFTDIKVVLGSETGQDVTGNSQYDDREVIGVNPAQGTSVVGTTQIVLVAKTTTDIGSG